MYICTLKLFHSIFLVILFENDHKKKHCLCDRARLCSMCNGECCYYYCGHTFKRIMLMFTLYLFNIFVNGLCRLFFFPNSNSCNMQIFSNMCNLVVLVIFMEAQLMDTGISLFAHFILRTLQYPS